MRQGARRDLFPIDRGLQLRMLLALAVSAVLTLALLAGLAWVAIEVDSGWSFVFFVVCFGLIGAVGLAPGRAEPFRSQDASRRLRWARRLAEQGAPDPSFDRLKGVAVPLCITTEMALPEFVISSAPVPLSWTTALPTRRPKIHITEALMEKVDDEQLAVVLAHELSHIANGDPRLFTIVAGPSTWILHGIRVIWEQRKDDWRAALAAILYGSYSGVLALPGALAARVVSRHREFAADRGAAMITGSPAQVAATLLHLSGALAAGNQRDLREVAARSPFYILPSLKHERRGLSRVWATHPPLTARVQRLQLMETALQGNPAP